MAHSYAKKLDNPSRTTSDSTFVFGFLTFCFNTKNLPDLMIKNTNVLLLLLLLLSSSDTSPCTVMYMRTHSSSVCVRACICIYIELLAFKYAKTSSSSARSSLNSSHPSAAAEPWTLLAIWRAAVAEKRCSLVSPFRHIFSKKKKKVPSIVTLHSNSTCTSAPASQKAVRYHSVNNFEALRAVDGNILKGRVLVHQLLRKPCVIIQSFTSYTEHIL